MAANTAPALDAVTFTVVPSIRLKLLRFEVHARSAGKHGPMSWLQIKPSAELEQLVDEWPAQVQTVGKTGLVVAPRPLDILGRRQ